MADAYTTGLKQFIINNKTGGGYITSSTTISTNDLNNRINQLIGSTYAVAGDLHAVAFSGDYTQLENTPQLADIALTGDYGDLKNAPQLSNVALSGSYYDLPDRPDLSATIQSELGNTVDDAIINMREAIRGGVSQDYDTLQKLETRKSEIIYINIAESPYNLTNFGNISFVDTDITLVNNILQYFFLNKIIILHSNYGEFLVNNLSDNLNKLQISFLKLYSDYDTLKENYNNDNNQEDSLSMYIIKNIKTNISEVLIIYDKNENQVFYISNRKNYLDSSMLVEIEDNLSRIESTISNLEARIQTLENYHNNNPEEPTEP